MLYLYTKKECGGCETARNSLKDSEVPIDNPITELGIQVLFKDGLVHAPILVEPDKGIYYRIKDEWVMIQNLKKREAVNA